LKQLLELFKKTHRQASRARFCLLHKIVSNRIAAILLRDILRGAQSCRTIVKQHYTLLILSISFLSCFQNSKFFVRRSQGLAHFVRQERSDSTKCDKENIRQYEETSSMLINAN
jgi:hypothetical protein